VERTVAWLSGCRRLRRRYERKPEHFLAFTAIAAASSATADSLTSEDAHVGEPT
jgi:transposase